MENAHRPLVTRKTLEAKETDLEVAQVRADMDGWSQGHVRPLAPNQWQCAHIAAKPGRPPQLQALELLLGFHHLVQLLPV